MLYQITESLGKYTAISVDSIPNEGICFELKKDNSCVIYTHGKMKDINMRGLTFPFVYNHLLQHNNSSDIYGGRYKFKVSFEFLNNDGDIQSIKDKKLYGTSDIDAIVYFYTMLVHLSYCKDLDQFNKLYKLIIDNEDFHGYSPIIKPTEVLEFIEDFTKHINTLENVNLFGLKQAMKRKFDRAKELISNSKCPE